MSRTVIPFGPQHPVLPEPIHLKLVLENETVVEALPALGYVHRGLESLVERKDYRQMLRVAERVCGICSVIHAVCYCQGVEELMGIEIPPRAAYLRTIYSELHRIHSHLLWLGLFADSFGFEALFMQCWRIREAILDVNEAVGGNRVNPSLISIGGVRDEINGEHIAFIRQKAEYVAKETKRLKSTLLNDYTVNSRTAGIGVLTRDQAYELGAAGPTLRGSGIAQDMRQLGSAAYGELDFAPITAQDGDCRARNSVRFHEVLQSVDLIRQALDKLPQGDIQAKVKGKPEGECVMRVEQPRGEVLYYLKADGTKNLKRMRIRTPTFANIPPLLAMLPGCELSDVPVIVLSVDPCISCTER